ncbi:hypothetical protein [Colwellia echini]|uniref:Uncharacterized protein n=1 Tax=Colwellia echini TaxID=1982103 RepID=A0ABY3MWB2_9GAMM|nr:hypothetical protein [Colwellia echini]TYK65367.1 hypothetical protein CWS31_010905 [Colwellia echini]
MLKNKQLIQSAIILLLFCTTFFAHSGHYDVPGTPEKSMSFDQHDCHLCQQSIDTPTKIPAVFPVFQDVYSVNKVITTFPLFSFQAYIFPRLRAPPTFYIV